MRAPLFAFATLLAAACAAPPAPPSPQAAATRVALKNADFEAPFPSDMRCPSGWNCIAHANGSSYRFFADDRAPAAGQRSVCIERVVDEPWSVLSQGLFDASLQGRRLRFSLTMRTRGVSVGAGPHIHVQGGSGELLFHDQRLEQGSRDWSRKVLEFTVPSGAAVVEVGATLQGLGIACFDEMRLEILDASKSPV
jgi:hypothetical protein